MSLHVDGVVNEQGYEAGLIFTSPNLEYVSIEYAIHLSFKATNNEAEYETLLIGLHLAKLLGVMRMHIYSDSQFIIR